MSHGVPPLSQEQVRHPWRAALGALPGDVQTALRWLRRGRFVTSPLLPLAVRRALLRLGGVEVGAMVYGLQRCYFESPRVRIGTGSYINGGCWFEGAGQIDLGTDCLIGPEVLIVTSTHALGADDQVTRSSSWDDVRIGDGCWIGARTMILPGVSIGDGTIVAAGAVVTEDCGPGGLYGGVPARRLR